MRPENPTAPEDLRERADADRTRGPGLSAGRPGPLGRGGGDGPAAWRRLPMGYAVHQPDRLALPGLVHDRGAAAGIRPGRPAAAARPPAADARGGIYRGIYNVFD